MRAPHKCPCCEGFGTRTIPSYMNQDGVTFSYVPERIIECRACRGTGIVWEEEICPFSGTAGTKDIEQYGTLGRMLKRRG